jgi:hypothetical protein
MEKMRGLYKILVRKPDDEISFGNLSIELTIILNWSLNNCKYILQKPR